MSYYVDSTMGSSATYSAPRPAMLVSDGLFLAFSLTHPASMHFFLSPETWGSQGFSFGPLGGVPF